MIKEIQGLRAIAILMVLFIHIEAIGLNHIQQEFFNRSKAVFFTSTGVEIFFVLAGFFMMNTLDKFKNDNNYLNIVQFIFSKFKRLAPSMYFWSLIALIMSLVSASPNGLWLSPIEMFKKFLSTIIFLRNFEEVYSISWFGIYWAISLEFQVFVIFSICYFLLGKKYVIAISLVLCTTMTFHRFGGSNSWLFRFDPILWGVLLYEVNKKINQEYIRNMFSCGILQKVIISIVCILILSSNLVVYKEYSNFNTTISSLLACLMLLLSLSQNNYFYIDIKYIRNIIDWLASRSYSIFCCHIVVWFIVREFSIQNIYVSQIISIIAMSICAEISYRFIENPSRGKIKCLKKY